MSTYCLRYAVQRPITIRDFNELLRDLRAKGHRTFPCSSDNGRIEFVMHARRTDVRWNSHCEYGSISLSIDKESGEFAGDPDRVLFMPDEKTAYWHRSREFSVSLVSSLEDDPFTAQEIQDTKECLVRCFGLLDNVIYNRSQKACKFTEDIIATDKEEDVNMFVGYDYNKALKEWTQESEEGPDAVKTFECWICQHRYPWWLYARDCEYDCFHNTLSLYVNGKVPCCEKCKIEITWGVPRRSKPAKRGRN